jgi:hypothetical protein
MFWFCIALLSLIGTYVCLLWSNERGVKPFRLFLWGLLGLSITSVSFYLYSLPGEWKVVNEYALVPFESGHLLRWERIEIVRGYRFLGDDGEERWAPLYEVTLEEDEGVEPRVIEESLNERFFSGAVSGHKYSIHLPPNSIDLSELEAEEQRLKNYW